MMGHSRVHSASQNNQLGQRLPVPAAGAMLSALGFDRKGLLWLGYETPDLIGLVGTSWFDKTPTVKEYALPTAGARMRHLTQGPDGNLWFVESGSDKLGAVLDNQGGRDVKQPIIPKF